MNSRLNTRLAITHLQLNETPFLGVHETGSRPKGIIETELDDVNGYDPNFFDDKSSLLSSSFAQPEFRVTLTGLSFSREAIEMLQPSALLSTSATNHSETRMRTGRPRVWDWDGALLHLMKIAQTPDGLPSGSNAQAEIERVIADWFVESTGNSPAESSIRNHADKIMRSLGLKA